MRLDNVSNASTFTSTEQTSNKSGEPTISTENNLTIKKPSQEKQRYDEKKDNLFKEEIEEAIEKANVHFGTYNRRFEISVHEKTQRIAVKVYDTETDEVIREIPPEKMLDLIADIWETAGILIDRKI